MDMIRSAHDSNRSAWNEGAAAYTRHIADTVASLKSGTSSTHPIERALLGDLSSCRLAVHLQCASGRDTLSLLVEGAQSVVGIDISDVHIANAALTVSELGWGERATFIRSDVLDVPSTYDGRADLVYTGQGALTWILDITAWAEVVARLLAPGGRLLVYDGHPALTLFDVDATSLQPSGLPYFGHTSSSQGWPEQYIGPHVDVATQEQTLKHERFWTLSEVFTALTAAGLSVEHLGEHREDFWRSTPNLPDQLSATLPKTFSMVARRKP